MIHLCDGCSIEHPAELSKALPEGRGPERICLMCWVTFNRQEGDVCDVAGAEQELSDGWAELLDRLGDDDASDVELRALERAEQVASRELYPFHPRRRRRPRSAA